jgi:hypothetical protein
MKKSFKEVKTHIIHNSVSRHGLFNTQMTGRQLGFNKLGL